MTDTLEQPAPPSGALPERIWPWALVIVVAVALAFANGLNGEFIFDDSINITGRAKAMTYRAPGGMTGRPLVMNELHACYLLFGLNPVPFHALNIVIHALAALAIFGVFRRTLLRTAWRERARPLAFAIALLWALHPLQTETVTYITQIVECQMGLFYALTLYAALRAWEAKDAGQPARLWIFAAVAACMLGVGCKEVIVTAPVVTLLLDRCFVAGSFLQALRRSPGLYAGLFASWIPLALLVLKGSVTKEVGFQTMTFSWWQYALTQPDVIFHYIRLAFWPRPLCFDYNWPVVSSPLEWSAGAYVTLILLGATVWALYKHPRAGFLGAAFFLMLAPTSSVMPLRDVANEHRMYLSLAAVLCGGMLLLERFFTLLNPHTSARIMALLGVIFALAAGALTFARNQVYESSESIWRDVVVQRPDHPRALLNLGISLSIQRKLDEALPFMTRSAELRPNSRVSYNLALLYVRMRMIDKAVPHIKESLRLNPKEPLAWNLFGEILMLTGQNEQAAKALEKALALDADYADAQNNIANALASMGKLEAALPHAREALRLSPNNAAYHRDIAMTLAELNKFEEAHAEFARAETLDPLDALAFFNHAFVLLKLSRPAEAIASYRSAVKLKDDWQDAYIKLAWVLAAHPNDSVRNAKEAEATARRACDLNHRRNPYALDALGAALAANGKFDEAAAAARSALETAPAEDTTLVSGLQARIELYRTQKPYREAAWK